MYACLRKSTYLTANCLRQVCFFSFPGAIAFAFLRGFAVSTIGMIGGVLVWCGIIASVFAPDMMWMSLTFGFVQGAGSGFVSMAVTVILMMYFDKYRGVATGIRCAGYSLSSLIYPPIFTFLSEVLPFRQLILIFAGITLHVTPLLLALKEPPWTRKSADVTNSRRRANSMKRIESERIRQQSEQNIKGSTKTKENRVFSERETAMVLNRKLDRVAKSIVCYSIGKRSVEGENSVTAREACNEVTARKSLKENNCVSKVPNRARI
ncbi:hypothetical protein V5799_007361 [Amblyomma americanum]|uniref:Monocarboxylate transporter n=1 Tax=Amblyomma americanum TaxID=6943 RepID=A0AAQ4DTS3_AMBAM